ncbi:MAG: translation initiation factor IF-5A [Pseudomonadota bacterium]
MSSSSEDSGSDFDQGDNGSHTYPLSAGAIRKGGHMIIKGNPCKIVSVTTSKTGKHGHAKAAITGLCLFTNKKCEDSIPTSHNVDVPNVTKTEYVLVNIDDEDFLTLEEDESGEMREDIKLSDHKHWTKVNEKIREDFENGEELMVTVIKAMGKECVISSRKM